MSAATFQIGRLLATPGVLEKVPHEEMLIALSRHVHADWGDVDAEDKKENDVSLNEELRLVSVYHTQTGVKFYIITEADRSVTTVLLPKEF
jgi:predicted transcriptional regulator with HTH domain